MTRNILRSIMVSVLISAVSLPTLANWGWTQNYGQVQRLYPTDGRTFFKLKHGQTSMNPTNGYYYIPVSHSNYDAMIDLLYLAAKNGWELHARTKPTLDSNGHAQVIYLVVDY